MPKRIDFFVLIVLLLFTLTACAQSSLTPTALPPSPILPTATKVNAPPPDTAPPTEAPAPAEPADLIFHNGTILTMEDDQPTAQAIAIKGGIILAVGSEAEILAYNGPETQVIDLQGRILQPGFIDPHTHILTDMGGIEAGQSLALENGFTSVADASIEPGVEADFFDASQSGLLRLRTTLYLVRGDVCGNDVGTWYDQYPLDTTVGERVRIGGVKIFADGGACGKVAASQTFLEGYENGEPYFDLETLTEMIRTADAAGYQVIIHAQGDLAIVEALDAYEAVLDGRPNVLRHRIEHNVIQTEQTIHRYGELGIIPTLFGSSEACRADLPWTDFYKQNGERPGEIIAANPGLVIAWHGDDPWQTPISPIGEYYGLVTRGRVEEDGTVCPPADWQKGAEVERNMALKMMTINAAYAIRQEVLVGSLAPGKYADLVILSDNLLSVPVDSIPDIQVLATIIGGQTEFCADPNGGYCPQTEANASSATETGSSTDEGLPFGYLDAPAADETISGIYTVAGWVLDDDGPIDRVEIYLDGEYVGQAVYGESRPDVADAYPGRENEPNFGFTLQLDTTVYENGPHTLSALAIDSSGKQAYMIPELLTFVIATETGSTSQTDISISGSRSRSGHEPALALDGRAAGDSFWSSGEDAPQWIRVDFPEPATLVEARFVVFQNPPGVTTHQLEALVDDKWVLVETFQDFTKTGDILTWHPSTPQGNVAALRMTTTESPSWPEWFEIGIDTDEN